ITQDGLVRVEMILGIENLYDAEGGGGIRHAHALEQALKAVAMFERDKDYVVRDGEVIIVDEFTGRLMPGRRYSDGLHQAIEAKEGVTIQRESRTVASITFQNYFRMYEKLSGMTGTAITNSEEFDKVYKLPVVIIPTNKPLVREDIQDLVFATEEGKFKAVIEEIKRRNEKGQPVLIGTTSIERNEYLSALLNKTGVKHELLNAKNHEREAEIIAQAGRKGAVTVATNMAGRGVDIILGGNPVDPDEAKTVREAGGLFIMGTERHEARRIDDQLRGRAGRQGDPGSSQFFLSLEDKMLRVFGGDRVQRLMKTLRIPEDQPIESKMISGVIENAQGKIEGMNFDTRKHLLDYDEVMNKQRTSMYRRRDAALESSAEELVSLAEEYLQEHIRGLVGAHTTGEAAREWDVEGLQTELRSSVPVQADIVARGEKILEEVTDLNEGREQFEEWIVEHVMAAFATRKEQLGDAAFATAVRWLMLRTIDTLWMDHLDEMEYLRDSVRLRAYAQRDPLVEYKNEGSRMFGDLEGAITATVATSLFKVQVSSYAKASEGQAHSNLSLHHHGAATSGSDSHENIPTAVATGNKEPGRNDPCYCGSGKKYKKCHGK
ncbi:MAG: SEC-C metal-binding domain-containing protein, partial [Candidatus Spechtbacterales bacterium]